MIVKHLAIQNTFLLLFFIIDIVDMVIVDYYSAPRIKY